MIKVLVVDDHPLVRDGFKAVLASDPCLELVGEARNGKEAVEKSGSLKPDIVLMDILMPELDGIEATKRIKSLYPHINVIVVTQVDSEKHLFAILQTGASGYVLKQGESSEILEAINTVQKGLIYLTPFIAKSLVTGYLKDSASISPPSEVLTGREVEILRLIADGKTSKEIAKRLRISIKTVQSHRMNIMTKLNFHDRTELVKYAFQKGFATVGDETRSILQDLGQD